MKATILVGDVLAQLGKLPDESVQCVVTSPPYWGLRDYGTEGQLGLEKTPDEYIAKMVEVFREVRRVLRSDGTLWLNMGDCYQGGDRGAYGKARGAESRVQTSNLGSDTIGAPNRFRIEGLKPKDLCGIPWMLAFALRADGWWLRQDIIWSKPNPMPESVTDRCTKAHEYLFLLTKSSRYYFDAGAIKEESVTNDPRRPYTSEGAWQMDGRPPEQRHGGEIHKGFESLGREGANSRMHQDRDPSHPSTRKVRSPAGWKTGSGSHGSVHEDGREKEVTYSEIENGKRNKRSVWEIATQAYSEAHFATFPEALVEPCILAGSKPGDTVLDPFAGSGTTGVVALRYHRDFVGIELNPEYARLAEKRIGAEAPMFNEVTVR